MIIFIKNKLIITKTNTMTDTEIKRAKKLEKRLAYGRGIYVSEWDELIILRAKKLRLEGFNPDDYNLDDRYCSRKKRRS